MFKSFERIALSLAVAAVVGAAGCSGDKGDTGATGATGATGVGYIDKAAALPTKTPIKHLVVIFGENISFDHYFGTYPSALYNAETTPPLPAGIGAPFDALTGTPTANNLSTPLDPANSFAALTLNLLTANPNSTQPFRLGYADAATEDMGHNYKPEQQAYDGGKMDKFPEFTGTARPAPYPGAPAAVTTTGGVMGYFDGNTVSAMWNYAQNFALNDNSWSTQFGPSTPGAINLISGQTNGFGDTSKPASQFSASHAMPDGQGGTTLIGDTDPLGDVCSTSGEQNNFVGKNIGDLLNAAATPVSWGWFQGGFDLTIKNANGTTGCSRETDPTVPNFVETNPDYVPHHQPFQYYPTTANPEHLRPSTITAIGNTLTDDQKAVDPANHQYDSHDFFDALKAGNFPAVSYLKAPAYEDGHAGYSNPVDEQAFVVSVVNAVMESPAWATTAIVLAYDDSDGWYDHQASPIVNPSSLAAIGSPDGATDAIDQLNGAGLCNAGVQQGSATTVPPLATPATALNGAAGKPVLGRCGYGTRQPLIVISPFAKRNYIDHTLTDQTSILRFIEDNWLGGARIQAGGSFDTIAGTIENMFDFPAATSSEAPAAESRKLVLDPATGKL